MPRSDHSDDIFMTRLQAINNYQHVEPQTFSVTSDNKQIETRDSRRNAQAWIQSTEEVDSQIKGRARRKLVKENDSVIEEKRVLLFLSVLYEANVRYCYLLSYQYSIRRERNMARIMRYWSLHWCPNTMLAFFLTIGHGTSINSPLLIGVRVSSIFRLRVSVLTRLQH